MTGLSRWLKRRIPHRYRAIVRAAGRPAAWAGVARSAALDARDGLDWLRGRRHPLVPPRKLVRGIGGSLEVGETYLRHFRELAALGPTEAVLDVDCGAGRMAVPLTRFLTPPGRYDGFDIVPANAAWCARAITPRFPHFRFQHADVFNREYNPFGRTAGRDFRFPYPDAAFDFAFLTSVFTHLMPDDATHYLAEVARVLRPGGRCLATFFLLNPESTELVDADRGHVRLHSSDGPARVTDPHMPEACVALDQAFVFTAGAAAGLAAVEQPYYGSWCGRPDGKDFQDIVVPRKADP